MDDNLESEKERPTASNDAPPPTYNEIVQGNAPCGQNYGSYPEKSAGEPSQYPYPGTIAPVMPTLGESATPGFILPNIPALNFQVSDSSDTMNTHVPLPYPASNFIAPEPQQESAYNTPPIVEALSDAVILKLFEKLVINDTCCCCKRPENVRKKAKIDEKALKFRVRYTLRSYVEKREMKETTEKVIGYGNASDLSAPVQDRWSYDLQPNQMWWDGKKSRTIQERVDRCIHCQGRGTGVCNRCGGAGRTVCLGRHDDDHRCAWCHGSGWKKCIKCNGRGTETCWRCGGKGIVKVVVSVETVFSTKIDQCFVGDEMDLPDKNLIPTPGNDLLTLDCNPPIPELPTYPHSTTLNAQAKQLLNKHMTEYGSGEIMEHARVLRQKHEVTSLPVTYVAIVYKEKEHHLWVYGPDNKVYCPELSSSCCCYCSIL